MRLTDIWNTPGYFYGVGYALSTILTVWLHGRRTAPWRRWLCSAALLSFMVGLMTLTQGVKGVGFVATMLSVVVAIGLCCLSAFRDRRKALFSAVKAFIYGEFASSLCWQIYYSAALDRLWLQRTLPMLISMTVNFGLIFALYWFIEKSLDRGGLDLNLTPRDILIEVVTALGVYVTSNLGYLDKTSMFSGSYARDIFAIRTLVDLSGVILIYAFQSQLIEVQLRLEKDALNNIMQMQYQAYQRSVENIEMVNQKYHDLKHQIALLKAQASTAMAEAYLSNMEREIQSYEAQNKTGNPVLDAVLTGKSLYCQNHGIELKCIADGALIGFMEDMEISALFGNMLDNAVESVERLKDPEKRLISLYMAGENGFLRIRIENYCEEDLRFSGGLPVTTKRDKRYHGFGMKSMQRTIEKYGGSMVASLHDHWFKLKILIPLPLTSKS